MDQRHDVDLLRHIVPAVPLNLTLKTAQFVLSLHFDRWAIARITELCRCARQGAPRAHERAEFTRFEQLAMHLSLLQAKVRVRLRKGKRPFPVPLQDPPTHRKVWTRASGRCEYCHLSQAYDRLPFQVVDLSGDDEACENIATSALACARCDWLKGVAVSTPDPDDGQVAPLFHPRRDRWDDHFAWLQGVLVGLTPCGRATLHALRINRPERRNLVRLLLAAGIVF